VARNGKHASPRPRIAITHSTATPVEAAAIAAAIEQFLRDTAPAPQAAAEAISPWLKAGLMEGIGLPADAAPWI
jgi:hypothetical protein